MVVRFAGANTQNALEIGDEDLAVTDLAGLGRVDDGFGDLIDESVFDRNLDAGLRDEIDDMRGPEFERFMADLLRQKGYRVEETPLSGDQGVDLVLPDLDGKRVVIQLKRWTGPVGNKAIQATFAGMAHYQADEGWIITTSTFTKSARELAKSTSVRLIGRDELADWLEGLREEEEGTPDSV